MFVKLTLYEIHDLIRSFGPKNIIENIIWMCACIIMFLQYFTCVSPSLRWNDVESKQDLSNKILDFSVSSKLKLMNYNVFFILFKNWTELFFTS